MAQPTQVKGLGPSGEFVVIDNGVSQVTVTANGSPQVSNGQTGLNSDKSTLGFDNVLNGATAQGTNSFGDTGTVLIDASGNDIAAINVKDATFKGNPVSAVPFSYAKVTKVLTDPNSATVNFKNPA
jgi:hypothetical protein